MGALKDVRLGVKVLGDALRHRQARAKVATEVARRPPLIPGTFQIGVYFADGPVNLYQLRQWYKPLAELAETWPVLVLSRHPRTAVQLFAESPLPVAYVRKVADLERVIEEQPLKLILYVNQNTRNFQMMRYGRRWHVFINHGESDKMYMTTNQFKAYDYALIAGEAARARLSRVLWDYDLDKRALEIGRPQADHYSGELPYAPDERIVVLYAPTWEGDRSAAAYGSIRSHGVALLRALLASGRHRVIYRPHPRSGVVDADYAAANRAIVAAIESANRSDPLAHHVFDQSAELGWQLAAADFAVVDISAMVYDRLAAGKPLFVTRPAESSAEVDISGYLSEAEWLASEDAESIVERIDELSHDEAAFQRLARWVTRYFGDVSPGATTQRFHAAVQRLMDEWGRFAALHASDEPIIEHGRDDENDDR